MQFCCITRELYAALGTVSRAASGRGVLPVLDGVLLRTEVNRLFLTGYNLELGVVTQIDAKVQEQGTIVLPAKTITEMVRNMPGQEVSFKEAPNGVMTVTSGSAAYSLPGMKAEDYPQLPDMKDVESIVLPAEAFQRMIGQTQFAVSKSDMKPVQKGALLEMAPDHLSMVSTDGYRLAVCREDTGSGTEGKLVIPGKALAEIARLSKGQKTVELQFNRKFVSARLGMTRLLSRLLDGEFFDYTKAIPADARTTVLAPTKALIESVTRASLLISDKLKSPVRVRFGGNLIRMSCETSLGRSYDEVPCSTTGSELEIGFNARYLLDALQAAGEEQVKLELGSPLAPMKITSSDQGRYLFLVLPVRLKAA